MGMCRGGPGRIPARSATAKAQRKAPGVQRGKASCAWLRTVDKQVISPVKQVMCHGIVDSRWGLPDTGTPLHLERCDDPSAIDAGLQVILLLLAVVAVVGQCSWPDQAFQYRGLMSAPIGCRWRGLGYAGQDRRRYQVSRPWGGLPNPSKELNGLVRRMRNAKH